MQNKYSEVIGSFIRRGNYPLEADYIFPNEAALKEFYSDPLQEAILHKGFLKIVENDGNGKQALYWVTKKQTNDELEFTRLVSGDIHPQIDDILAKLEQEIEDRQRADWALWGTMDNTTIPDEFNSIRDLYLALLQVKEDIKANSEAIQDLKETLDEEVADIKEDIATIIGSDLEPEEFLPELTYGNISKINETLEGIMSGEYIKILTDNEDDVIALKSIMTPEGVLLSGKLILSPQAENQLQKKEDGLYYDLSSEYEEGILTIRVNGNIISQHNIGKPSIVESAKYDPTLESLVIRFKLLTGDAQEVMIPLTNLIREWDVDNAQPSKVVELVREEVFGGGADRLSADVRLSDNKYNILERDVNRLLVRGTSDNIRHNDVQVSVILEEMYETFKSMTAEIQDLRDRIVYLEANGGGGGGNSGGGGNQPDVPTIPISISQFTANNSESLELAFGQVVDIVLNWAYNLSSVSSQTINGVAYDVSLRTQTFSGVSEDITYTLIANASNGTTATKTVTIKFLPVIYSGASIDDAGNLIIDKGQKVQSIELNNATVDAKGDYYTYIVPTASVGNGLKFSTPGFEPANEVTNYSVSTTDVQLPSGKVNYTIYKLDNKYNGIFQLNVKQS